MVRTKKQIVEQIARKKELDMLNSYIPERQPTPPPPIPYYYTEKNEIWMSVQKLQSTFTNLTLQEINEMLVDCGYNEEQVILRLITQANYLSMIRQRLYVPMPPRPIKKKPDIPREQMSIFSPIPTPIPMPVQTAACQPIPKPVPAEPPVPIPTRISKPAKPEVLPIPTPTVIIKREEEKKPINRVITGRLALDDALKQIQNCQNDDHAAFEGWSDARLRAYKMIDKNPNSYYYRFNAPGEQQKKGKWSDEENALFLKRLGELGANTQWGIFSIAIPGRVGYQCSNYYRFLIESGQLKDPNYVIDESGKARYLFDKKADDGSIEKIFRKHSKHGSIAASTKRVKEKEEDDPDFTMPYKKHMSSRVTRQRFQQV